MGTKWTVIYEARQTGKTYGLKQDGRKLGLFFLGISLVGSLLFFAPVLVAEVDYRINTLFGEFAGPKNTLTGFGELLWFAEKGVSLPADREFSLVIPRLGINTRVLHSVDSGKQESYKTALSQGAAHAEETALPNEPGTTYIFGHSSSSILNIPRYNPVFYPLAYIKEGDDVVLFYNDEIQAYKVQEKKIVEAGDTGYFSLGTSDKRLVLQTCWPPGTTWKRLVIIAKPIEETSKSLLGLDFGSI